MQILGVLLRNLSKSRLLSFRQCPKRLWLELHRPELKVDSTAARASFQGGHELGAVARRIYDPEGRGVLVDPQVEGYDEALARSRGLLSTPGIVFEAGAAADGAVAFADILVPIERDGRLGWHMVEVKSAGRVKDYHRDDAAIQAYVFRAAGVALDSIAVARVDGRWVYPGDGRYEGLLVEEDLTGEAMARAPEVRTWIAQAQGVAAQESEPAIRAGAHCNTPFACGFAQYCQGQEPRQRHPVSVLPRLAGKLRDYIDLQGIVELEEVPDAVLNPIQQRVKGCTLSGRPYFDAAAAAAALAPHPLPALFLDFEAIGPVVPIWKGTRPFQQVPFQFSLHRLGAAGVLEHESFLDLSGSEPSRALADRLVAVGGTTEPVFVYNAGFERGVIEDLARRFPALRKALLAIADRLVDLLPITRKFYYHPAQAGSWSIKAVLPTVAPDLAYDALDGVKDGAHAQAAYAEAIRPETPPERKAALEASLLAYCRLDTYAMVRLWKVFAAVPASRAPASTEIVQSRRAIRAP